MSTATQVKHRRGSSASHSTFVGAQGEFTFDTDLNTIRAHDGGTPGGWILLRKNNDGSVTFGDFVFSSDGHSLINNNAQANWKIKNGQFYFWDPVAYAANPSLPWRIFGANGGNGVLSDPVAG